MAIWTWELLYFSIFLLPFSKSWKVILGYISWNSEIKPINLLILIIVGIPNITFQLFENGSKKIENDVYYGDLDMGITVLPTNNFYERPVLIFLLKKRIYQSFYYL
jgi:hypothetical protein